MLCYTVREGVSKGFEPQVQDGGLVYPLPIEEKFLQELEEFFEQVAQANEQLAATKKKYYHDVRTILRATITQEDAQFVLKKDPKKKPAAKPKEQALVFIETHAGVGGRVFLTSLSYDEVMTRGRVRWQHRPFPPAGIQACATDAELERIRKGVPALNLVVVMNPGAGFRISRDGRLEGASPQLFVHWNGERLWVRTPGRYGERVEGALAGT